MELFGVQNWYLKSKPKFGHLLLACLALLSGSALAWGVVFHSPFLTLSALLELSLATSYLPSLLWQISFRLPLAL